MHEAWGSRRRSAPSVRYPQRFDELGKVFVVLAVVAV